MNKLLSLLRLYEGYCPGCRLYFEVESDGSGRLLSEWYSYGRHLDTLFDFTSLDNARNKLTLLLKEAVANDDKARNH